jgi:protein-tyrosine phosphatase
MKTIIFVCHGSICRSPAAGFIAMQYLKSINRDKEFNIIIRATSNEEIGHDIYPPMKKELKKRNINIEPHSAARISQAEYEVADFIFYMDAENFVSLKHQLRLTKNNTFPINKWTPSIYDIEDPWYTGRFALVCEQITMCIHDIFEHI